MRLIVKPETTTIAATLKAAATALSVVSDSPALDAEILLAHTLDASRMYLRTSLDSQLTATQAQNFSALLSRRLQREPIAYLTGHKEFWSLDLKVNAGTLIPRPETEILVETALQLFPEKNQSLRVADLGTGSGAIALALASERPLWDIHAVDNSESALLTARDNAQRLRLMRVAFCLGNWFTALPAGELDLVVSNPPYISEQEWPVYADDLIFEPQTALLSDDAGLSDIREICGQASLFIRPGGYLMLEHGYTQGLSVRELLTKAGCKHVRTVLDLSGQERVTVGQF